MNIESRRKVSNSGRVFGRTGVNSSMLVPGGFYQQHTRFVAVFHSRYPQFGHFRLAVKAPGNIQRRVTSRDETGDLSRLPGKYGRFTKTERNYPRRN